MVSVSLWLMCGHLSATSEVKFCGRGWVARGGPAWQLAGSADGRWACAASRRRVGGWFAVRVLWLYVQRRVPGPRNVAAVAVPIGGGSGHGHGIIAAEYFDFGHSRRLPWTQRPHAAALLAALHDPERGFDAVVVGEYERAFYGNQLLGLGSVFADHGVQLWLPETHGPLDLRDSGHRALTMLLGAQSRREVLRARFRVTAAMRAHTREQGRYLGGRPPYGYHLVDAGPHPNVVHAGWGRRLRRLEPDPATAPTIKWIFAQRLAGRSAAHIARMLNEQGVVAPSTGDPNRRRTREGWSLRTVAAILANPRYTGRQVWNRQRTDHDPPDGARGGSGRGKTLRWNTADEWVISKEQAHPPLVSEADFIAAQQINAVPGARDGSQRQYLLVGLLRCGRCGRRLDSHWVHGRPGYRCRHGHTSAHPPARRSPVAKTLYLREDHILERIRTRLARRIDPEADPRALVSYLHTNDLIVTCTARTCVISDRHTAMTDVRLKHAI
jgi:site-specific DNA recombinase